MIVVPAIDLRHGKVVRLIQGLLDDTTVYGSDPGEAAREWEAAGAKRLHVVDLDAAIEDKPQPGVVGQVIDAVNIPVEVGGGLRVLENAARYKDRGADRLIFGTAAVARPGVVQEALKRWPEAVAVAVDAKAGKVALAGWQEISTVDVMDLIAQVREWGVRRIQHTDIVRDGTLKGPNLPAIREVATVRELSVTVAGGVSSLDDLRNLHALGLDNVDEVVVGKALYEERFSFAEAVGAAGGE